MINKLNQTAKSRIVNLKQRTNKWLDLKNKYIGSSEIFSLIKYYATDNELLSCGIQPEELKQETAFDTAFGLYHKIKNIDAYSKKPLSRAFADYGSAMEKYGKKWLADTQTADIHNGLVFVNNKSIASCDIMIGWTGAPIQDVFGNMIDTFQNPIGIIEQKTIHNIKYKNTTLVNGLDWKTIIQHNYQMWVSGINWGGILTMVLKDDTNEERAFIAGMSQANNNKFFKFLAPRVDVKVYYVGQLKGLIGLFEVVLERFFYDVDNSKMPEMYPADEEQKNVLNLVRYYREVLKIDIISKGNLEKYLTAKENLDIAEKEFENQKGIILRILLENKSLCFEDIDLMKKIEVSKNNAMLLRDMK